MFTKNADKYFTPASNTKIFTLYTALKLLGDSLALFHFSESEDSLIFWGAGNPLLLHPDFPEAPNLLFLQNTSKPLYLSMAHFQDDRFGAGWSWDDYRYYFQVEKTALPIYGNVARFERDSNQTDLQIHPKFFC